MAEEPKDEPFWSITSWLQLGYGSWVNLTGMIVGMCYGYTAVAMPYIKKDPDLKSTLSDEAWIASVLTLSAPFGCFLSGYCMEKCGRRASLILCEIPLAAGFLYIALAQSTTGIIIGDFRNWPKYFVFPRDTIPRRCHLYIGNWNKVIVEYRRRHGRVIKGFGMGMAIPAPRVYTAEICLPRIRAVVGGAIPNLAMGLGLFITATLGTFVSWRELCYISATICVVLLLFNCLLPESPYFFLMQEDIEKAKNSLSRLRSKKYNLDAEIKFMVAFKEQNDIQKLKGMELFRTLFKPTSCKPFCIIIVYITFTQFSGVSVVTFWAVEILQASRSTFDPNLGNLINSVTRCLSGILISILLYYTGRRVLGITSAIGTGICRIALGMHEQLAENPGFWPQVYTTLYTVFSAIGYNTLPLLVMSEIYPLQVRGALGGITVAYINFLMFVMNKTYPYMETHMGFSDTFIFYGGCSLLCAIFIFFFLPETKGLSLQQIEEFFNHHKVSLKTERQLSLPELQRQGLRSKVRFMDADTETGNGESVSEKDIKKEAKKDKEKEHNEPAIQEEESEEEIDLITINQRASSSKRRAL